MFTNKGLRLLPIKCESRGGQKANGIDVAGNDRLEESLF